MPFKRLTTIQIIIAVIVGLVLVLLLYTPIDAYIFNWKYTGFGPKTIWDWLELLIIPLVLAVGGYMFTRADKQAELDRAEQQTRTEREIAEQRAQDALLQTYLDQMSELLVEKGLRTSKPGDEVRHVAQVRTLIALRRLDQERRTILIQFLQASQLVGIDETRMIVDFRGVDLSNSDLSDTPIGSINLRWSNLRSSNLTRANLVKAYLANAYLRKADLTGADLYDANLQGAELREANLEYADLFQANLGDANLQQANLMGANLGDANLFRANLFGASLEGADLQGANLFGADIRSTNLVGANLKGANLKLTTMTQRQFRYILSLEGVTVSDISIYE